jgi:hypothetical protein
MDRSCGIKLLLIAVFITLWSAVVYQAARDDARAVVAKILG